MKKVGIWLRVSTDIQAQSDSPEHHERRARSYAESKGWEIITVYHLEAVSGKDVMHHPEAMRMIEDIQCGRIDGLIFSKIARLARNTVQLLQIAKIFEDQGADLISLEESIDTSSPVGKLFFTMTSAMAQWEREEIGARVKASVKIRAELGKPLGGQAPYGYAIVDKTLILHETESAVRRYMFELFAKHKRQREVCNILYKEGYRTRKGEKFSPTTLKRLLTDPICKGLRRSNYTESLGAKKHWKYKPKKEWIMQEAPRIVSDELWQEVNDILELQKSKSNYPTNTMTNLFTGLAFCTCGGKMYVRTRSPRYICTNCKLKIRTDDLEHIFFETLSSYLKNESAINIFNSQSEEQLIQEKNLLDTLKKRKVDIANELNQFFQLHRNGEIPTKGFGKLTEPLFTEQEQVDISIEKKQADINTIMERMKLSASSVQDAKALFSQWDKLPKTEKRAHVEALVSRITIGKNDVDIELAGYLPRQQKECKMSNATVPLWLF